MKDPGSKLVRWRLKIEDFNYEVVYKPGRVNSNADCVSSVKVDTNTELSICNIVKSTYDDFVKSAYDLNSYN